MALGHTTPEVSGLPARSAELQLVPPPERGLFISEDIQTRPELELFNTYVESRGKEPLGVETKAGVGTLWRERWRMSNDLTYKVTRGIPLNPRTDILLVEETPLGTQPEGYNEGPAWAYLEQGWNVLIIGPDEGAEVSLQESSHNSQAIISEAIERGKLNPDWLVYYGFSRGAEKTLGNIAYSGMFDRRALYSHAVDPYGIEPLEFSWEQVKDGLRCAGTELNTAGRAIGDLILHPSRAWGLRHSVDISPAGLIQAYRNTGPVLSGETGLLASHCPTDIEATIVMCGPNDCLRFQQLGAIFDDEYSGVVMKSMNRGHFANLFEKMMGKSMLPFGRLLTQLEGGVPPDEVDFNLVHRPALIKD